MQRYPSLQFLKNRRPPARRKHRQRVAEDLADNRRQLFSPLTPLWVKVGYRELNGSCSRPSQIALLLTSDRPGRQPLASCISKQSYQPCRKIICNKHDTSVSPAKRFRNIGCSDETSIVRLGTRMRPAASGGDSRVVHR